MTLVPGPFSGVAYRAVAGVLPLWWAPNHGIGRWHGGPQQRPVQYLSLHPMGALAEHARHAGAITPDDLGDLRRNVFALRITLERALRLDFDAAHGLGINAETLVGPPSSYPGCAVLFDTLLRADPALDGMLVPSAALPGTTVLVIPGRHHAFPYDGSPRRTADIPCAVTAMAARPALSLAGRVRPLHAVDHPALEAWRRGEGYQLDQPMVA